VVDSNVSVTRAATRATVRVSEEASVETNCAARLDSVRPPGSFLLHRPAGRSQSGLPRAGCRAIQQAIDKVQEINGEGIVFVPEGRYRLTKTLNVWPAIRLIGYGTSRPVFVLGESTPG